MNNHPLQILYNVLMYFYSMFPLLKKDGLQLIYWTLIILFNTIIRLFPIVIPNRYPLIIQVTNTARIFA